MPISYEKKEMCNLFCHNSVHIFFYSRCCSAIDLMAKLQMYYDNEKCKRILCFRKRQRVREGRRKREVGKNNTSDENKNYEHHFNRECANSDYCFFIVIWH